MSSEAAPLSRLTIDAELDVQVTLYDGMGAKVAREHGTLSTSIPHGLYRIQLERGGRIESTLIDFDTDTQVRPNVPPLKTPTPTRGAATSHEYYTESAVRLSTATTSASLGARPHDGHLMVFVRRESVDIGPRSLPSEPLTLHDVNGRPLVALTGFSVQSSDEYGYAAYSARAQAGIYRLRANTSRRDIAIPVPPGRAVHLFAADVGTVRIDDVRIFIPAVDCPFDPDSRVTRAMEAVIGALKVPHGKLSQSIASLVIDLEGVDLCLDIAAALVLIRDDLPNPILDHLVRRMEPFTLDVPDAAIIKHVYRRRRDPDEPPLQLSSPPLFRASFLLAMNSKHCGDVRIHEHTAIAQSARAGYHDSVWWTWSNRVWDARWIQPTIDSLCTRYGTVNLNSIATTIALPTRVVESTIAHIDASMPAPGDAPVSLEGITISGYDVGELIGRGSQGVVYRARRVVDGRAVALKVIAFEGEHAQRRTALAEVAAMKRFDHCRLLGLVNSGSLHDDTGMWLELELCRGSVMDRLAELDAPMSIDEACHIMHEGLEGLAYLHDLAFIHRDVKPGNLLLRNDGSLAVADFGLTKTAALVRDPSKPRPLGTARFAAPEQLLDANNATPSSDVWSAAATLYFMLSLELPRDEFADQSELEAARINPVIPVRARRPDLPMALANLIDAALSVDPSRRPQDAAAFRIGLTNALGARPSRRRALVIGAQFAEVHVGLVQRMDKGDASEPREEHGSATSKLGDSLSSRESAITIAGLWVDSQGRLSLTIEGTDPAFEFRHANLNTGSVICAGRIERSSPGVYLAVGSGITGQLRAQLVLPHPHVLKQRDAPSTGEGRRAGLMGLLDDLNGLMAERPVITFFRRLMPAQVARPSTKPSPVTENDAASIAALLRSRGFELDLRTGERANATSVEEGFTSLVESTNDNDAVVIYYGGRGIRFSDGRQGATMSVIPHSSDTEWISLDLWRLEAKTKNITAITDARLPMVGSPSRPSESIVQLSACNAENVALDSTRDGIASGIFTDALIGVLSAVGDLPFSWEAIARAVSARVAEHSRSQSLILQGPSTRRPFSVLPGDDRGGHEIHREGDLYIVPGGRLTVAVLKDRLGLMPPGSVTYDSAKSLGELEVVEVLPAVAKARLLRSTGELPLGVVAIPIVKHSLKRPVLIDVPSEIQDWVQTELSIAPTLRVARPGDRSIATLYKRGYRFEVIDEIDTLFPDESFFSALEKLSCLAAADGLRRLEGEHGVALDEIEIKLGVVENGAITPTWSQPVLALDDRLCASVANRSSRDLYFHFFTIGIEGRITQLETTSGILLTKGQSFILGLSTEVAKGLPLSWPLRIPRGAPRIHELIVIVTTTSLQLRNLATRTSPTATRGRGNTRLQDLFDQLYDGNSRDVRDEMEAFLVGRLPFFLLPLAGRTAGTKFVVDETPVARVISRAIQGDKLASAYHRDWSPVVQVRLVALDVFQGSLETGLRLDALICTLSADGKPISSTSRMPIELVHSIFEGKVSGFLDIAVFISRDVDGVPDLGELLARHPLGDEVSHALRSDQAPKHLPLALGAAAVAARAVHDLLCESAVATCLFHASYSAGERFGHGWHPGGDVYRAGPYQFSIEILAAD